MNIALCLSGYVGFGNGLNKPLESEYKGVKQYISGDYDIDIYLHSWSVDREKEIFNLYKPKNYIIENQKGEDDGILDTRYSQWYSRCKAIKLSLDSGINYDWIMATRFDLIFNMLFDYDKLNNKNIYIAGQERVVEMNDIYFLSGRENMEYISNFYPNGLKNYGYKVGSTKGNQEGGAHWTIGKYVRNHLDITGYKVNCIGFSGDGTIKFVKDSLQENYLKNKGIYRGGKLIK